MPEATRKMLELAGALGSATDADVKKAGDLAQAWNKAWLAIQGRGRQALNGEAGGISLNGSLASMLNTFAKDQATKHDWQNPFSLSWSDYWNELKRPFTAGASSKPRPPRRRHWLQPVLSNLTTIGSPSSGPKRYGKGKVWMFGKNCLGVRGEPVMQATMTRPVSLLRSARTGGVRGSGVVIIQYPT